jgi:excisionase family DNA binding protein
MLELLKKGEFAARLGVHVSTIERWMASGKLQPDYRTPGGHPRFAWPPAPLTQSLAGEAQAEMSRR